MDGPIYTYAKDEMMGHEYADANNVSMVMYMEAGKNYYIDIAPYDVYAVCDVWFDIEFMGETYQLFRSCSPSGAFTTVDGNMGAGEDGLICEHIDAAINPEDGYYHEVLERDAKGNPVRFGSIVYAYFTGATPLFPDDAIADLTFGDQVLKGMISKGAFNFGLSSIDEEVLFYLEQHNGDMEATLAYLKTQSTEYDPDQAMDTFEGIYHGFGKDETAVIETYLDKMITGDAEHPELEGCVPVDAQLMQLLQWLVDKYSFAGVEHSWQKLCFYYDYMG